MNNTTKKILSFAGVPTTVAHANNNESGIIIEGNIPSDINYTVQSGDTLGGISLMFFGTPNYYLELANYNNIENPALIYEGQVIRIPRNLTHLLIETYPREFEEDQKYIVEDNDILFTIIEKFYNEKNISYVNKLATYNDLEDPNLIYEGQELLIPEKAKLELVIPNDYTLQYQMLEWRITRKRTK